MGTGCSGHVVSAATLRAASQWDMVMISMGHGDKLQFVLFHIISAATFRAASQSEQHHNGTC